MPASIASAIEGAASALHVKSVPHTVIDFVVMMNADGGARYGAAVSLVRRSLPRLFEGRFDKHPTRAVTVFVFSEESTYRSFCAPRHDGVCPTPFGMYDPRRRDSVMHATPGAETSNHELVHVLIGDDLKRAPALVDEGIASLFEAPVFCADGSITGETDWRYPQAVSALSHPEDAGPPLASLFSMSPDAFLGKDPAHPDEAPDTVRRARHEALGRFLIQWLDWRGLLWAYHRALRASAGSDPTGEKSFEAVTGPSPADADPAFEAYVRSLAPPAHEKVCP